MYSMIRAKGKLLFDSVINDRLKNNILHAIPFWIASLLTGVVAVIYSKLFSYSESQMHHVIGWHPWLIFILTPACFCCAWYIVQVFAPNAKGSGIPQVMAAIDLAAAKTRHLIPSFLSLRIIFIKIASSLFMILGGAAIGREGPTIQIAGSIFRLVNKWTPAAWPKLSQKSFILTGAAAGLAAAFNTPLGGIVFAIEELAKIHINFFKTALFTSVIIAGLTAQGLLGPYLYLGYPDVTDLTPFIFGGVIVTAAIAGVLGAVMCKIVLKTAAWKKDFNKVQSLLFIISAGLIVASIAYYINDDILGSGKDLMTTTLFGSDKSMSLDSVLFRTLGPILSYNTGGTGGVFAPALAAGASLGAYLADISGIIGANANILILSGMVGFLTGVTRTPFTSAILVLEMTDRHNVIFHLMLAALVSGITALIIDKHSFYEQLKKQYLKDADI